MDSRFRGNDNRIRPIRSTIDKYYRGRRGICKGGPRIVGECCILVTAVKAISGAKALPGGKAVRYNRDSRIERRESVWERG